MKKNLLIVFRIILFFSCAFTLYAENKPEEIEQDSKTNQTINFESDFFIMPAISVYGGYPEYFSFDLGADFLFPSIIDFPQAYGFYAMGGLGNGSDITNIRISTGISLQSDYIGLKVGIGGDFSFLSTITHNPFFFTEAVLRLCFFNLKVIYDFNTDLDFNTINSSYKQNPKFYIGIDLVILIANIFKMNM